MQDKKPITTLKRRTFLGLGISAISLSFAGAIYWPNRWKYIVIHHSAGNYGNIEILED